MEPWFAPWMGGVLGAAFGILGGTYGTIVGICAPRGIARVIAQLQKRLNIGVPGF